MRGSVTAGARSARRPRVPATARVLAGLLLGLAAALLAVGCAGPAPSTTSTPPPSGPSTFDESGLVFDYPAGWRVYHFEETSSFFTVLAWLGTAEMHDPCSRTASSMECGAGYTLDPGAVMVTIEAASFPGFDILDVPAGALPLTVDGLPGWTQGSETNAATGATAARMWAVARPGSIDNYFSISASARAPDDAALLDQVDRIVRSIRYRPPVSPLPADPAAAVAAGTKALAASAVGSDPSWRCFPPPGGSRTMTVSSLPNGPPLSAPRQATCTTSIEATAMQVWRMTLEMRLAERDANGNFGIRMTIYLDASGAGVGGGLAEDLLEAAP